jgi:hypothetical protein
MSQQPVQQGLEEQKSHVLFLFLSAKFVLTRQKLQTLETFCNLQYCLRPILKLFSVTNKSNVVNKLYLTSLDLLYFKKFKIVLAQQPPSSLSLQLFSGL